MRALRSGLCCAAVLLLLARCSSSSGAQIVDAYRAPGTVSFTFDRVAVIVLNGNHDLRSSLEDEVVKTGGGKRLVAAHTVLGEDDMRSYNAVRQALLSKKFDGAVTMRLVRPDEIDAYASKPGESFSTYAEGVPAGEAAFGGKTVVETNIYRLSDEELIWRGVVTANKGANPQATIREIVQTLAGHMRDTGLLHD
jgi:hypothetical protein